MARISLKEAYDNRDVIAWLVKHEDEIDELMNILKDINPSGDLTNIVTKTGDQTIDGIKTFIGKIVADCDIIQNGGNYETHAEQVFTTNDYIVMRDGAVSGLGTGQFSGFQVKKYNGSDDGRLVMDSSGVARVGDLGDEQPLLTRAESAQLNNGDLLQWNSTSQKAVSANLNTSQIVRGTGNIGSDTKPVKVVGGVATPITDDLLKADAGVFSASSGYVQIGADVYIVFGESSCNYASGTTTNTTVNLPFTAANNYYQVMTTLGSAAAYWGDIALIITGMTVNNFTISLRCETSASTSGSVTVRWMTVVKKA